MTTHSQLVARSRLHESIQPHPRRLHGIVLNLLNTGTTSFCLYCCRCFVLCLIYVSGDRLALLIESNWVGSCVIPLIYLTVLSIPRSIGWHVKYEMDSMRKEAVVSLFDWGNRNSRFQGWDFSLGPCAYETGVLFTTSWCWLLSFEVVWNMRSVKAWSSASTMGICATWAGSPA
jgi:hypothetical protein